MTGKPTEKMVWRLKKLGFNDVDIVAMTYEQASKIIGASMGEKMNAQTNTQAKVVMQPQTEFVEQKGFKSYSRPQYNPSSQYVSYAKDVYLSLREMLHTEIASNPKIEIVTDEVIMQRACDLIDIAINHFNPE